MSDVVSLADFLDKFPTEDACYQYLLQTRWPDGFQCPRCGHKGAYFIPSRKQFQCTACKKQTSITAGTVFHRHRLPIRTLFWAVYLIASSKKGISAMELQRKLDIGSYKTAWMLYHKIRTAMVSSGKFPLTKKVEVDETYVGGRRPGKRGRGAEGKSLVVAAVETDGRYMGRSYLTAIDDASIDSLSAFVSYRVAPSTMVRTDAFKSYRFLTESYSHVPVTRKSLSSNDDPLPKVHMVIANLKMWLLGTYNCLPSKHLQKYLDEFIFRFNRRWNLGTIFDKLLNRCLLTPIFTYAELTA